MKSDHTDQPSPKKTTATAASIPTPSNSTEPPPENINATTSSDSNQRSEQQQHLDTEASTHIATFSSQTLAIIILITLLSIVIELGVRLIDYTSIDCQEANIYSTRKVYEDPSRHLRLKFIEQSKSTNGEYTTVEMWLEPSDSFLFPLHKHADAAESIQVLSGTLNVMLEEDGELMDCTPNAPCTIVPEMAHTWGNVLGDDSDTVHLVMQVRPSHNFEPYVKTVLGLANDTTTIQNRSSLLGRVKNWIQDAVIEHHYHRSTNLDRHLLVNRLLVPMVARIGKIFGYRPCYPQYF